MMLNSLLRMSLSFEQKGDIGALIERHKRKNGAPDVWPTGIAPDARYYQESRKGSNLP